MEGGCAIDLGYYKLVSDLVMVLRTSSPVAANSSEKAPVGRLKPDSLACSRTSILICIRTYPIPHWPKYAIW
jgi:hypothetical protein